MSNWCNAAYKSLNVEPTGEFTPCGIISPMHGSQTGSWDLLRVGDTSQCQYCKVQESVGSYSVRQLMNAHTTSDDQIAIEYLNLNLSNVCNLQCHSCDSSRSVLIPNRVTHQYDSRNVLTLDFIQNLIRQHASTLRIVSLQGGEPFLWSDLNQLMTWLRSEYPHIKTALVTNLGRLPKWVLDENPFHRIKVSLDGVGKVAEMTRVGTNWLMIKRNLKDLMSVHKPIVSTTISSINLEGLRDLSDFILERGIEDKLDTNIVMTPGHLSVLNLSDSLKEQFLAMDYGLYSDVVKKALRLGAFMDFQEVRQKFTEFPVANIDRGAPILARVIS